MSYINRKIKKLVSKFNIKKLSKDNYKENEIQVESELDSSSVNINHKNCYYYNYKPWCKECVPRCIIEGWTSENHNIDEFIKDTIYNAKISFNNDDDYYPLFLEWVPFDRFEDIKQIGEGGFAKVYSATWVDGQAKYKRKYDGIWKKKESSPMKIALKRLNDSQNISVEYLNELQIHCDYCRERTDLLKFYGMTKDPVTKEFMMIVEFSEMGNLRTYRCMNAIPDQRPTANELFNILHFWYLSCTNDEDQEEGEFGYKRKEIKAIFEEADKEIPNISTTYEKNPDAVYTSRLFTFSNLPKPINSPIITSYLNEEENKDCQDSQLLDLEVPSSREIVNDNENSS
ncbi:kinase-like domain-containing protein [Rhizophagus irregularis DAOM 181602=DAOM 197198]|nr:kinase-like domain-containing protein [Rhizophagus irregularis DAOM 181602=DAOM 197198]